MSNWKISELRDLGKEIEELSIRLGWGKIQLQEGDRFRSWHIYNYNWGNFREGGGYLGETKNQAGPAMVRLKNRLEILVKEKESNLCRHCLQPLPENLRH